MLARPPRFWYDEPEERERERERVSCCLVSSSFLAGRPTKRSRSIANSDRLRRLTSISHEEWYSKLACLYDVTLLMASAAQLVLHGCCWRCGEAVQMLAGWPVVARGRASSPLDPLALS